MSEIRTVLLVDDDAVIRMIGEMTLTKVGGWDVSTAESGADALIAAADQQPDLILLDVMMPGMDGVQTLQELGADPATQAIPVIFMTAKVLPGEVGSYVDSGARGVIAKPFDPMTLPAEIESILAASSVQEVG